MTTVRALVQIDGRWHSLTGRTAAIVSAVISAREEIDSPPFLHIDLECRPRTVKLALTTTHPAIEVSTTAHE